VRDYVFGMPSGFSRSTPSDGPAKPLTTPEREQICAAFTFKTPSPVGTGVPFAGLDASPTRALAAKAGKAGDVEALQFHF
jgi:hypothetical protein